MRCAVLEVLGDEAAWLPAGSRYELDRHAPTRLGRRRTTVPERGEASADIDLNHRASRVHCEVRRVGDDAWELRDLGSASGTYVRRGPHGPGTRLKDSWTLQDGDELLSPWRVRFSTFQRERLLDHAVAVGDWILFGRDRRLSPGVWPAFGFGGAEPIRAAAVVRDPHVPVRAAVFPDDIVELEGLTVEFFVGADGIPVAALPELQLMYADAAARMVEDLRRLDVTDAELVVTLDGEMRVLPTTRAINPHGTLGALHALSSGGYLGERRDVAAVIRSLFPDEWRLEEGLRDELAVLSPEDAVALCQR